MSDALPFRVEPSLRIVVITWPDVEPELGLWRASVERVLADPLVENGMGIVSDRRQLTRVPSTAFIRGFISTLELYVRTGKFTGRFATVVSPNEIAVYGMARMAELLGDHPKLPYRVFKDFDEAVAWVREGREA